MKLDWLEKLVYNKEPKFSEWDSFEVTECCKVEVSQHRIFNSDGVCPHCGSKIGYTLLGTEKVSFRAVKILWHEYYEGKTKEDNEILSKNGYEIYKPQSQELVA